MIAGVSEVDLTPMEPAAVYLAGAEPGTRAAGVDDPICARALYLAHGATELAIVSVDLGGALRPWVEDIRLRVTGMANTSAVVVVSNAAGVGPDAVGMAGPRTLGLLPLRTGRSDAWLADAAQRVARAVDEARDKARPARARSAAFEVPSVANPLPGAVLQLIAEGGEPVAMLLSPGAVPWSAASGAARITSGLAGALAAEAARRNTGTALLLAGPGTSRATTVGAPGGTPGETAKRVVGAALEALEPVPWRDTPQLLHRCGFPRFRHGDWRARALQRLNVVARPSTRSGLVSEVHWFRIGELEALTAPGRIAPAFARRVSGLLDKRTHKVFVSLAGEHLGPMGEAAEDAGAPGGELALVSDTAETLSAAYAQLLAELRV